MPNKNEISRLLAEAHRAIEPTITCIVRIVNGCEEEEREPVKLLEVNPATSPSGVLPIAFTANPPQIPYPSVIIEVTEDEYGQIQAGGLALPVGWRLGNTLFSSAA